MAAAAVVAQPLTLTGSIGVVTGKFNAAPLYERVGYAKTLVSKGRDAEMLTESRGFTQDELALFDAAAQSAYELFRDRAAAHAPRGAWASTPCRPWPRAGCGAGPGRRGWGCSATW